MKWIGERTSFVDQKDKTTIVIEPENIGWQKIGLGAWFFMWLSIGAIMFWSLSLKLSEQEIIIVAVFLSFWAYYAWRVGRQFFWLMRGKENIKINEVSLTIKNSIGKYGKAVPYYIENIRKMRIQEPKENSLQSVWEASPWVKGGERIEFDYMGKVVRFGRKLKEKEAKLVFNLVTKRLEEQLRKKR